MIQVPVPPQLLPLLAAMMVIAGFCFLLAFMGWTCYRWKRDRHDAERVHRIARLHALAAIVRRPKGEGIEA